MPSTALLLRSGDDDDGDMVRKGLPEKHLPEILWRNNNNITTRTEVTAP
jgi:hypothetical protein